MLIRMLTSTTGGFAAGGEYDVSDEKGRDFCQAGFAEPVGKKASEKRETRKKTTKKKTAKKK